MPRKKKVEEVEEEKTAQDEESEEAVEEKVEEAEETGEPESDEEQVKAKEEEESAGETEKLKEEKEPEAQVKEEESGKEEKPEEEEQEKEEAKPEPKGEDQYEDKVLKCKDCGKDFVWTAGQQAFYAEKGFENPPLRCENCRRLKKQRFRSRRRLYEITCDNCGKKDMVPVPPGEGRKVLCWDCFKKSKEEQSAQSKAG